MNKYNTISYAFQDLRKTWEWFRLVLSNQQVSIKPLL